MIGEIVVDLGLENASDRGLFEAGHLQEADIRRTRVRAVANTGAVMLALPEDVVERLGAREVGRLACTHADGRRGERPIAGPLIVHIGDRWTYARCVVNPTGTDSRVGRLVMGELDLVVNHATQTLGPRPESPDRPLLRL